jgi:hypothetical protein
LIHGEPYSFRHQFADQWYDLNNPDQTATPMVVSFSTMRVDFPPNVENFAIGRVALDFVLADEESLDRAIAVRQRHAMVCDTAAWRAGEYGALPTAAER